MCSKIDMAHHFYIEGVAGCCKSTIIRSLKKWTGLLLDFGDFINTYVPGEFNWDNYEEYEKKYQEWYSKQHAMNINKNKVVFDRSPFSSVIYSFIFRRMNGEDVWPSLSDLLAGSACKIGQEEDRSYDTENNRIISFLFIVDSNLADNTKRIITRGLFDVKTVNKYPRYVFYQKELFDYVFDLLKNAGYSVIYFDLSWFDSLDNAVRTLVNYLDTY